MHQNRNKSIYAPDQTLVFIYDDQDGAAFLNCSVTCIRIQCDITLG